MIDRDKLYASPRRDIVDFAFDQSVTDVFPDMIRRSIPGYETVISLLAVIAGQYYQPGRRIYDLGCSLGAATLAVQSNIAEHDAQYIAVDSSASMVEKCRTNLAAVMPVERFECIQQDILDTPIEQAGIVILNFTLQFLAPDKRLEILQRIYAGLLPGGVLIMSEKVHADTNEADQQMQSLYHAFKAANGYSDLEISQKRSALEKVMRLDTVADHSLRLEQAGFDSVRPWFQCFNFISLIAVR